MVTDLGEQPTPEIEPAEPPPGGVDAIAEEQFESQPLVPDLTRIGNEPSKDAPDEVTEPDATDTAATKGDEAPDQEAPA
jgi:hypothetical protein